MADAVKMAQDFESKTIAVSLKDRGAILPAGHTANAAYWYDSDAGHFISSTYYMDALPAWVEAFNAKHTQHDDIRYVPEGNDLVAQMAIAALRGEVLGQGATTDFLAVSFSSTDYIGHRIWNSLSTDGGGLPPPRWQSGRFAPRSRRRCGERKLPAFSHCRPCRCPPGRAMG